MSTLDLENKNKQIRRNILTAVHAANSGHIGSSFSMVEIFSTLLFQEFENHPDRRNYFILSKGHAAPCLYAAYAVAGKLPTEQLNSLREIDSPLQGHPVRGTLPFIDASTGSLGQGLSMGIGYALGSRLQDQPSHVYVVLGDGETQEGQNWEAAMAAVKFKLGHLTAVVDYNKYQLESSIAEQMPLEPYVDKWQSFGWHVQEINGHSIEELSRAYKAAEEQTELPSVIIAHTVKGKGVSFMENNAKWHGAVPTEEELNKAFQEL